MTRTEWTVHPNRFDAGGDDESRNGRFRSVTTLRPQVSVSTCLARVTLPRRLSHLADPDGSVTFGGKDWWFVVGAARTFARSHITPDVPPPFGFTRAGKWWWWDNTSSEESILDGREAIDYVREYLAALFPQLTVTVTDSR
jgi:hypothetical protein